MRQYISANLGHPVCGMLLKKHLDTDAAQNLRNNFYFLSYQKSYIVRVSPNSVPLGFYFIIFNGNIIDHIVESFRNDAVMSIRLFKNPKGQRQSQLELSIKAEAKCYYSHVICHIFSLLYFVYGTFLPCAC